MRWPFRLKPNLDWVQVEITTECSADCRYCPRHTYRDRWIERRLPVETFRSLLPELEHVEHVHLQGWGEPLMHPDLPEMIRLAKNAGHQVGTTTNGMRLTEDLARELVGAGLDILAVSLAGLDGANDSIRRGTRIRQIKQALNFVRAERERRGGDRPRLHVAYMLLRSRLADIEELPVLLEELQVDEAVVSSTSLVIDPALEADACLARDASELQALEERLLAARQEAARRGCALHFHLAIDHGESGPCSENVGRSCVVTSAGEVVPCVFSALPLSEPGERVFRSRRHRLPALSFGNVADARFRDLWQEKGYRAFRRDMERGEFPAECVPCAKRFIATFMR